MHVVPADAGRLIATRRLDPQLFDVTELVRLGYHDDAAIPVILPGGVAGKASKGKELRTLTDDGMVWLDGVRTLALDQTVPQIGAPASTDAALAVGAVDKTDAMADFSSRGPRLGDGAVKPDLVAPGVAVTAARAGGGHVAMDGTSMAAPHVSGAAALLAEEHPNWTGQQLKAALIGSTTPVAGTEYDQGAGRVDVARAITQTVTATPANLGLGVVAWPHTDAVEKPLTYHNDGPADVTLRAGLVLRRTRAFRVHEEGRPPRPRDRADADGRRRRGRALGHPGAARRVRPGVPRRRHLPHQPPGRPAG